MPRFVGEDDMLRWSPVMHSRSGQAFRCPLVLPTAPNERSVAFLRMCDERWVLRVVTTSLDHRSVCLGRAQIGSRAATINDLICEANYWLRESLPLAAAIAS